MATPIWKEASRAAAKVSSQPSGHLLPGSPGQREKSGPGKPHTHSPMTLCLATWKLQSQGCKLLVPTEQSPRGLPGPPYPPLSLLQTLPFLLSLIKTARLSIPFSNHPIHSTAPGNFQTVLILFSLLICIVPPVCRTQGRVRRMIPILTCLRLHA